jgi:hypothetical protein
MGVGSVGVLGGSGPDALHLQEAPIDICNRIEIESLMHNGVLSSAGLFKVSMPTWNAARPKAEW